MERNRKELMRTGDRQRSTSIDYEETRSNQLSSLYSEKEIPRTKRMLRTAEEAKDVAINSLDQLQSQGEQLDRAEGAMERMEGDLNTADWLLRGMRSYSGAVLNYFVAPPTDPTPVETKQRPVPRKPRSRSVNRGDVVVEEDEEWVLMASGKGNRVNRGASAATPQPAKPAPPKEEWMKQRELDEDLDKISVVVNELKGLSMEAGKEVQRQNEQLDRLNEGMDQLGGKLAQTNKKVKKHLKGR